jgi:5-(carboxyamino)imidazole ribonucleotide synthase
VSWHAWTKKLAAEAKKWDSLLLANRMKNEFGILGGGQLALMLAHASTRMGIKPIILAETSISPAAQVYSGSICGALGNPDVLSRLFSQVQKVVFENEFVNCQILRDLSSPRNIRFFPSLEIISQLQDKLNQKRILEECGIPSAAFEVMVSPRSPQFQAQFEAIIKKWDGLVVLKWARMGYDGKGVYLVDEIEPDLSSVRTFCLEAEKSQSVVYAEKKVKFRRELAVVGVRSITGEFLAYPLVVSEQENGICSRVYGPATSVGVSPILENISHEYARRVAERLGYEGTFAIEYFETHSGELWVNEIAPRVHNSGHYTQNACATDQFENHWRAILGMPLGSVHAAPGFAMVNLLGPDDLNSELPLVIPFPQPKMHLHWYGKKGSRPKRKLGHLNGVVQRIEELNELLKDLENVRNQWREANR